ncbi:MAG: squalene/phytoene synthase family protein [Bdellovibrionota bacterium]
MSHYNCYKKHLENVSRSFSFCIAELNEPLRSQVGLAYILCRILDTIEDAHWSHSSEQSSAYNFFLNSLEASGSTNSPTVLKSSFEQWQSSFPISIPDTEKALLLDFPLFLSHIKELSENAQKAVVKSVSNMARGMIHFSKTNPFAEKNILPSLPETNLYCFFVAGVVGELLTDLASELDNNFNRDSDGLKKSVHFGLFLQKINILKDQQTDESEGRFFVGSREQIMTSLKIDAELSFAYILSIPNSLNDYKIFCAWSFYLALLSIPFIQKSWAEKKSFKISRTQVFLTLNSVKSNIEDNRWLENLFLKLSNNLVGPTQIAVIHNNSPLNIDWVFDSYRGDLKIKEFSFIS